MARLRKEMTCFGYSLALAQQSSQSLPSVLLRFSARTSPSRPGQDPQQCPRPSRADGHPHRSPSSCPASYQVKIACPFSDSDGEPEGLPHRHPLVAMRRRAMDHVELRNTGARVHSASFPHRVSRTFTFLTPIYPLSKSTNSSSLPVLTYFRTLATVTYLFCTMILYYHTTYHAVP